MALEIVISSKLPTKKTAVVKYEKGAKLNSKELGVLNWITENVGGKILVLKTKMINGIKSPDLQMDIFAEIKNTSGSLNTLDKHIRQAAKQTRNGRVFVDITDAEYSNVEAIVTTANRMLRSGLLEACIIRNDELVAKVQLKKENR